MAFVGRLAELVADELGADRDVCASWVIAGAEVFVDENRHEYEFEEPVQRFLTRLIPRGGQDAANCGAVLSRPAVSRSEALAWTCAAISPTIGRQLLRNR